MTDDQLQQIIQIARLAVTNEGQAARMLGLVVTDLVAEVRRLQGKAARLEADVEWLQAEIRDAQGLMDFVSKEQDHD